MDRDFLQSRIDSLKLRIVSVENAILELSLDGILTYTMDTGQTRTTVTRQDLPRLNTMLGSLMNQLATLQSRLNGCGVIIARAGF